MIEITTMLSIRRAPRARGSLVSFTLESGLAALRAGGDFADGSIASQGERLGGPLLSSFDRRAVSVLRSRGANAAEPSELVA